MEIKLSTRIRILRQSKQLSQAELAKMIGVSQQVITNWERDKSAPNLKKLNLLATAFNIPVSRLVEENSNLTPKETTKEIINELKNMSEEDQRELWFRMKCNVA